VIFFHFTPDKKWAGVHKDATPYFISRPPQRVHNGSFARPDRSGRSSARGEPHTGRYEKTLEMSWIEFL
jgi:hypothetical protein